MLKSEIYIYIDGVDGTGKTTLVKNLKKFYSNVSDRSIMTKLSFISIPNLPPKIMSNNSIKKQLIDINKNYDKKFLTTNRSIMSKLIIDKNDYCDHSESSNDKIESDSNVYYFILDAEYETIKRRLLNRNDNNFDVWEEDKSLKYFKNKYLYLAFKYDIPIIDTTNLSPIEVLNLVRDHIDNSNKINYTLFQKIKIDQPLNLFLLELLWLNSLNLEIIYCDNLTIYLIGNSEFNSKNLNLNQDNLIEILSKECLNKYIENLCMNSFDHHWKKN